MATKGSLVGVVIARYGSSEPALTEGEIVELSEWVERDGEKWNSSRGGGAWVGRWRARLVVVAEGEGEEDVLFVSLILKLRK